MNKAEAGPCRATPGDQAAAVKFCRRRRSKRCSAGAQRCLPSPARPSARPETQPANDHPSLLSLIHILRHSVRRRLNCAPSDRSSFPTPSSLSTGGRRRQGSNAQVSHRQKTTDLQFVVQRCWVLKTLIDKNIRSIAAVDWRQNQRRLAGTTAGGVFCTSAPHRTVSACIIAGQNSSVRETKSKLGCDGRRDAVAVRRRRRPDGERG